MDEDKGFENICRALVKSDLIVRLFSYFRYHNNMKKADVYVMMTTNYNFRFISDEEES